MAERTVLHASEFSLVSFVSWSMHSHQMAMWHFTHQCEQLLHEVEVYGPRLFIICKARIFNKQEIFLEMDEWGLVGHWFHILKKNQSLWEHSVLQVNTRYQIHSVFCIELEEKGLAVLTLGLIFRWCEIDTGSVRKTVHCLDYIQNKGKWNSMVT